MKKTVEVNHSNYVSYFFCNYVFYFDSKSYKLQKT